MNRFFSSTLLFFLFSNLVNAQAYLNVNVGYSSSKHESLRELNEDVKRNAILPTKTVNDFDPSTYILVDSYYQIGKQLIGSYFYYTKTGYRDGLKDSTGLIRFEQLLGVASIGLQYGLQVSDVVAFGVRTGVNWTTNSLSQELKVYDQSIYNESYKLEASGFEIQPFLKVGIPLNDWWEVYGEAGYNIDINNEFKLDGDETDIKPDWSGFRVSLGIGFKLN